MTSKSCVPAAALVVDQLLDEGGADARRSPFALHGHPGDLRAALEGTLHGEEADDLAAVVGHIARLAAHCGRARVDAALEPEEVGKARQHRVAGWRVSALELADDHRASAQRRDSAFRGDVDQRGVDAIEVVLEVAERGVAAEAQQAPDVAGLVVVVDVEALARPSEVARTPRTPRPAQPAAPRTPPA